MKLAFVGGGTMAEAMIRGVLEGSLLQASDISVGEPLELRCRVLEQRYNIYTSVLNSEAIERGDMVVLAVKPTHLGKVMNELRGNLKPTQTILSIVAGARLPSLVKGLGHQDVIRVMPNTPGQIGAGISVWTHSADVGKESRSFAQAVLRTMGKEIHVSEENYLDMATALSASGPAYTFLFMEALIDAGVYLGLPREMARTLSLETVFGSCKLMKETGQHPAQLRDMVTSPGGTTVEGLLVLEEGGMRANVLNAVLAAYEKSLELGDKE